MRVLHLINSMQLGGAEVLLANTLAKGALPEHTENHLIYLGGKPILLDRIDPSVKITALNYTGGLDIIRILRQLRKKIKELNIDIIHSHLTAAGLYSHLLRTGIPQVHTLHTTYSTDDETRPLMLWLEKHLCFRTRNCNVICLTEYTKNDFINTVDFKGKAFVLNNFVNESFFNVSPGIYSQQGKSLKLIAIGSLKPLKNFEYLLSVFEHLKGYNISLDIFGGGNTEPYENVIHTKKLNIRMMGSALNLNEIIANYDLFIMPSKREGLPLSVFEAMAASVPVMVSDIPPLKAIVKEHGIYFSLDDPERVAKQLLDIYNGNININSQAIAARQYAEEIAKKEVYINNLLKIYNTVIGGHVSANPREG